MVAAGRREKQPPSAPPASNHEEHISPKIESRELKHLSLFCHGRKSVTPLPAGLRPPIPRQRSAGVGRCREVLTE